MPPSTGASTRSHARGSDGAAPLRYCGYCGGPMGAAREGRSNRRWLRRPRRCGALRQVALGADRAGSSASPSSCPPPVHSVTSSPVSSRCACHRNAMQQTTCDRQQTTCDRQHTTCDIHHTTCERQHAPMHPVTASPGGRWMRLLREQAGAEAAVLPSRAARADRRGRRMRMQMRIHAQSRLHAPG